MILPYNRRQCMTSAKKKDDVRGTQLLCQEEKTFSWGRDIYAGHFRLGSTLVGQGKVVWTLCAKALRHECSGNAWGILSSCHLTYFLIV